MISVLATVVSEHPWRFDLASLAAILAAAGTGLLAFFTWRLAKESRSLAKETGEDVRAEWRPVVVTLPESILSVTVGTNSNVAEVATALANVGKGPAIN